MEIHKIQDVINIITPTSDFIENFSDALIITETEIFLRGTRIGQLSLSGASSARPSSPWKGMMFFDETLGKMIVYNGTAWVNMDGTPLA